MLDCISRAFRKSCTDVIESQRAIRNLNTMYPDLTDEELANVTDPTCIICREDMQVQQSIKRLSCQHVFHKNCLRSWFQRQQTCMLMVDVTNWILNMTIQGPICRTTVLRPSNARDSQATTTPPATPQPQADRHNTERTYSLYDQTRT
jgi:hypothetical protein